MATYQIPAPSPMSIKGNVVENWNEFECAWNDYLVATELNGKLTNADDTVNESGQAIVAATLCSVMGAECKKVLNNLPGLTESDRKKPEQIIRLLKQYFTPQKNVLYERFVFNSATQKSGESIDEFTLRLRKLAESCEFGNLKDSLIRDRLVIGTSDEGGRERLLRERPVPDLNRVTEHLRAAEISREHRQVITGKGESASVDHMKKQQSSKRKPQGHKLGQGQRQNNRKGHPHRQNESRNKEKTQNVSEKSKCKWCGGKQNHFKNDCPARSAKCYKCQKVGHFSKACFANLTHEICNDESFTDDFTEANYLGEVNAISDDFWSADILVDRNATPFKLDSGSKITVVGENTPWVKQTKLENCTADFRGPGGVKLSHLVVGKITEAKLQIGERRYQETVYVMKNQPKNLLSKAAIQALRLLKPDPVVYNVENTPDFKKEFPNLFKGLGLLKYSYKIPLRDDAVPVCLYTPRRVPHPLLPKVKDQLKKMEGLGVISPVTEPTEWCSGMVIAPKPGDKIRICVDLTPLNKAVKREIHPMATVDENLAKFQGSQIFSKLDANSGFWQIPLDKTSRLMTTFVTPYGRYCFNRLPFGISSAPEVFQRVMSQILEGLDGVICHMDDVLIHGPSQEVHDRRVRAVLNRLQESGLTLNEKCEFSKTKINFLGHVISPDGIAVDPRKRLAIQRFPVPANITELQRFNGMVNQLAKFLPNLARINEPLRQLLRKEQQWMWDRPQEEAFQKIKDKLVSPEVLAHYDPNKPSIVAADASQDGLGAVLLQEDEQGNRRPIAFASRSLSDTEKRYAVIEKEALAATWACEKFSDYILGTTFTLETDHRPLVPLLSSSDLSKLPSRILRFRLRLMRYAPAVKYIQGIHQKTADALSRAPTSKPTKEDLILVEEVEEFKDIVIKNLPATDQRLQKIKEAQESDAICKQVKNYVQEGWPPIMPELPLLRPFWDKNHHLTVNDGLLMYDNRVVIPQNLQIEVLNQIHAGHLGITKCKGRAYNSVWWPNITAQIEAMCNKCSTCALHRPERKEPLLPFSVPNGGPWDRVGTDLFHFEKKDYIVLVDYTSRWLDFKELQSTTTQAVIRVLCEMFATHGAPNVVVSDNGPQFSSQEFKDFAKDWGFTHVTSSPRYPQSNGEAERAVQTAKNILKKNANPYLGLLAYRTAPLQNGKSPSQILMSRLLRTSLPTVGENLKPSLIGQEDLRRKEESYKQEYANNYNKRHRVVSMPLLNPGDTVYVRDQGRHGEVVERLNEPRSYKVNIGGGATIRRNRRSLIHTGVDNETSPSAKTITPDNRSATPKKINPRSPSQPEEESTSTLPSTPFATPVKPVKEMPGANNLPSSQTTRLGRTIKCNRKPDMFYYK